MLAGNLGVAKTFWHDSCRLNKCQRKTDFFSSRTFFHSTTRRVIIRATICRLLSARRRLPHWLALASSGFPNMGLSLISTNRRKPLNKKNVFRSRESKAKTHIKEFPDSGFIHLPLDLSPFRSVSLPPWCIDTARNARWAINKLNLTQLPQGSIRFESSTKVTAQSSWPSFWVERRGEFVMMQFKKRPRSSNAKKRIA